MPLRITILSGDRQGQTLEFDQDVIEIGDRPSDDIVFDAGANPGVRDRHVTLKLLDGSWKVQSTGTLPVFLNQDTVSETSDLRSGDFLRISHDGPDLSCELIGQLSPIATVVSPSKPASSAAPATPAATTPSAPTPTPEHSSAAAGTAVAPASETAEHATSGPPPASKPNWLIPIVAGVGLLMLLALLPLAIWRASSDEVAKPELVPFGVITVEEGEQVFWRPKVVASDASDRFSLGDDAPEGMLIDASTGTVRWKTSEKDGPGEYRCELTVQRGDDATNRDSDWLEIQVKEVNQLPEPKPLATQNVDLHQSRDLVVTLQATDDDLPKQSLEYRLGADVPDGVTLDPKTGVLTWQVSDRFANRDVTIPFSVSDGGQSVAKSVVRVRVIKPDPWDVATEQLRDCLYFVVTENKPGKLVVPLGTACAIFENRLLTRATVAHGINDARWRGWKVMAVDTRDFDLDDPQGWELTRIQSHAVYVRAQSIADPQQRGLQQAFFDLAILTTDRSLPVVCTLGDLDATVKNDQTVAVYGFEVEEGSLTRFDSLEPAFTKIKVLEVVAPSDDAVIEGRPPFLLQLIGELPFQPFGSIVVDEGGSVLGIYAFQGALPGGVESEPVHYAVDSVHAKAFLAGEGTQLWLETEPKPADSGNQ